MSNILKKKSRVKAKKSRRPTPPPPSVISTDETEYEDEEEENLPEPEVIKTPSTSEIPQSAEDQARLQQLLAASRSRKQSFWETVCYEIEGEFSELDIILTKLGLPPYNYRKDKMFPLPSFPADAEPPPMDSCITRLYLDYYIFPHLLAAIQSMIQYARRTNVFQCRAGLFNPLDYIVEYLYTNNPKHPQRKTNMIPIMQIPFASQWIMKNPRPPYPKWLRMSEDEAAQIIQSCVRMWLARRKRKELELRRDLNRKPQQPVQKVCAGGEPVPALIFAPYYDEINGEGSDITLTTTHSHLCVVCSRFRQFVLEEEMRLQQPITNSQTN